MRQGAYYVSLLMMGFLAFLLILGVIRAVLWVLLILSIGRGGWLFPNLFADVGFFESFVPLWTYISFLTLDGTTRKKSRSAKQKRCWSLQVMFCWTRRIRMNVSRCHFFNVVMF